MWKQSFDPLFMRFHWGFERSRKNDSARFESHHRHHFQLPLQQWFWRSGVQNGHQKGDSVTAQRRWR